MGGGGRAGAERDDDRVWRRAVSFSLSLPTSVDFFLGTASFSDEIRNKTLESAPARWVAGEGIRSTERIAWRATRARNVTL